MDLEKYSSFYSAKKAEKDLLAKKRDEMLAKIDRKKAKIGYLEEALDIMNVVGVLSQEEFRDVIEELVTQALQFVFGSGYSFELESSITRDQPEIRIHVVVDGVKFSSKEDELGGGVSDVVSLALRVILWAIRYERTEPVLIFDEPFKFLDYDRLPCLREMLSYLSETLGLQFIVVTHDSELAELADTHYYVEKEDGVSKVTKVR